MRPESIIEVAPKKGVADPAGRGLLHDIRHLGIRGVKAVGSAQLYKLIGRLSSKEKERIAQDLLCDPIIQEYRAEDHSPSPSLRPAPPKGRGQGSTLSLQGEGGRSPGEGTPSIVVDVWFKSGVTDVVGDSVAKGIRDLSIGGVEEVRTGMRYHLYGLTNQDAADRIAVAFLSNPLIQDRVIHAD